MTGQRNVRTCFWFARRGIDAAQSYVKLLPDSRIDAVFDHGRPDDPMVVEFTVAGAPMMILTGGDMFKHSPAASISVLTKDQADRIPRTHGDDADEEDRHRGARSRVPYRMKETEMHPDAPWRSQNQLAVLDRKNLLRLHS